MRYTTRIIVPPRVRRSGPPGSPGGAYGPQVLGVRKTFGFGDRLGAATAANIAAAAAHPEFAPVFAQQPVREMMLMGSSLADVLGNAARAVGAARFRQPWGADADRLRTAQEVTEAAEAGFTCFTFDPSEFVRGGVDELSATELQGAVDAMVADGDLPDHWAEPYLERTIDLPGNHQLQITLEPLQRAVVRYAPAVVHCARLSSALARSNQGRPFEIEVVLDAVDVPATALEHLFIGLELEARGVRLTGLALRYLGGGTGEEAGEPGILAAGERQLREHAAVAEFCGPYKLCFYEAEIGPFFYPVIGRVCGDVFHLKTTAASYLEALRVVSQVDPALFREIVSASAQDRALAEDFSVGGAGSILDQPAVRQSLDAAFTTVMTNGQEAAGRPFKQAVLELLDRHADLYTDALTTCFEKQFELLSAG